MLGAATEPAQLLTQHLIQHGHKRIGMIGGPRPLPRAESAPRVIARRFERQARRDPSLYRESRFGRSDGSRIGRELLEQPDPADSAPDRQQLPRLRRDHAAESLGLSVPGDLAIASFDDFEIGPREPILTCADQPASDIAELAPAVCSRDCGGDDSEPER